jgi:hypothetical protein
MQETSMTRIASLYDFDKTKHPLAGTLICKNNFFNNPEKVLELAKKQTYEKSERFPGKRTINLLESTDAESREFGVFFAKKLAREVFPGISQFVIHISFHINEVFEDDIVNAGWIHNDDVTLAGLVYLNPFETNFNSGTSIFLKNGEQDFSVTDFPSRKQFNISNKITEEYKIDLENNHNNFEETIKVGNVFNRLIAYDSNLWHRPNTFKTADNELRTTLLFFIDAYQFDHPDVSSDSKWID